MRLRFDFSGENVGNSNAGSNEPKAMVNIDNAQMFDYQKVTDFKNVFHLLFDIAQTNGDIIELNVSEQEKKGSLEYISKEIMLFANINSNVKQFLRELGKCDLVNVYTENQNVVMRIYYDLKK